MSPRDVSCNLVFLAVGSYHDHSTDKLPCSLSESDCSIFDMSTPNRQKTQLDAAESYADDTHSRNETG